MPAENRTEQPTQRRRTKAREKGQVLRSQDLPTALTLLAVTFILSWQPRMWIGRWQGLLARLLATGSGPELGLGSPVFSWTSLAVAQWLWPTLLLALSVAVFSTAAQGGFVFAPEPLKPDWNRLNPARNLGRLFSLAGLSRLLRSLIPAGAVLAFAYSILMRELPEFVHAPRLGARALLTLMGRVLFELAWKSGLVLLAWSGADYLLQRWHFQRSLRMTKQEVREEMKETEGNPAIRGRIKRLRREMRRKMMLKAVERATAVVTNPTHYAVALEYRPEKMPAPIVVAKGRNLIAQKIKQLARWHDVPIVENPPLAQALYKAVEVGDIIPPQLYAAVAEILAFLYRAQLRMGAPRRVEAR